MRAAAEPFSLFASVRRFPAQRRRGGQPENRNRLKHGGFSRASATRSSGNGSAP